jgi:hypothetical protein
MLLNCKNRINEFQATLILYANEKRINQKELVDLIIRTGRIEEQTVRLFSNRRTN